MEPLFLATELRKLLLWLTLECFRRNSFENRSIGLVGLVVCLKNDRNRRGFPRKLLKIHAHFARNRISEPPLLEILDPPLIWVKSFQVHVHVMQLHVRVYNYYLSLYMQIWSLKSPLQQNFLAWQMLWGHAYTHLYLWHEVLNFYIINSHNNNIIIIMLT